MKLWASLERPGGSRELDLEARMEDGELVLEAGEGVLRADVARLPDGESYSLLLDGRSHEVSVREAQGALRVTSRGGTFRVTVRNPLQKMLRGVRHAPGPEVGSTLRAPMPGLVVSLRASAGEAVRAGQALLVVEAMKMQNEIAAEIDGVVRAVHVSAGQSVESGQALVTIDPETKARG